MSVEFMKVVPLSDRTFGLSAGVSNPLKDVQAETEDALVSQLVANFKEAVESGNSALSDKTILVVEKLDDTRVEIVYGDEPQLAA